MPELGSYNVTIVLKAQEEISNVVRKATESLRELQSSTSQATSSFREFQRVGEISAEGLKIVTSSSKELTSNLASTSQALDVAGKEMSGLGVASSQSSGGVSSLRKALRDAAFEANAAERAFKVMHDTMYDVAEVFQGVAGIVGKVQNMFTQYQVTQIRLVELQEKVAYAQEKYNEAVAKYGENSRQAQEAARRLADAQRDLEQATFQANMQLVGFALQIPGLGKNVLDLAAKIADLKAGKDALITVAEKLGMAFDGLSSKTTGLANAMGALNSAAGAGGLLGTLARLGGLVGGFAALLGGVAVASEITERQMEQWAKTLEKVDLESRIDTLERLKDMLPDAANTADYYISVLERELKTRKELDTAITENTVKLKEETSNVQTITTKYEGLSNVMKKYGEEGRSAIEKVAKAFGLQAERVTEIINKMFNLNIVYDEHEGIVKMLVDVFGLTEDQAKQLVQALEQEAEAQKKAKEAAKEHTVSLEDLTQKMMDAAKAVVNYGSVVGPLAGSLEKLRDAMDKVAEAGGNIPGALQEAYDYFSKINDKLVEYEGRMRELRGATDVASVGISYYNTLTSIGKALIVDEVQAIDDKISKLKEELKFYEERAKKSKEAKEQLQGVINELREQIDALEDQKKQLIDLVGLTEEQAASQERLKAIQDTLSFTTQTLSLMQTGLQLAMMGATSTGESFMNTVLALADAQSDGIITEQEFKDILQELGVQFDESGKPVLNLKDIMQKFKEEVLDNINKVQSFRDTLKSLDGMTVHTYHIHHIITVSGATEGGEPPRHEISKEYEEWEAEKYGIAGYAQRGEWYTREGLYRLHAGEMVLPRNVAEWFRSRGPVAAQKTVNVRVNINAGGVSDPNLLAEIVSRKLVQRLRAM